MWAAFTPDHSVVAAPVEWAAFEESDDTYALVSVFGAFARETRPVSVAELPTSWTHTLLALPRFDVGRLVPWARVAFAPPPYIHVVNLLGDVSTVPIRSDGATLASWSDCSGADVVLVDATTDRFVPRQYTVEALAPGTTLRAELRVPFMLRHAPVLNDAVAHARRSGNAARVEAALAEAWRLYLDAATQTTDETHTMALVCETTRRDGPRFMHSAVAAGGGAVGAGLAVLKRPALAGVAMMAHLLHALLGLDAPALHQLAKLCPDDESAVQLVYVEQRPLLARSLRDVLLVPDAMAMRRRIDRSYFSSLFVHSVLCGFASVCPEHVYVYVSDIDTGACALGLSPRALESAFSPSDSKRVAAAVVPLMCNVIYAMSDELDMTVAEDVRACVLQVDAERLVLDLLGHMSTANDRAVEMFSPDELQSASLYACAMVRPGLATDVLNKLVLLQALLRENVTHRAILRAVHPHLLALYEAAESRSRRVAMDTFRLVAKETHQLSADDGSLELRATVAERARLVCGDAVLCPVSRALLRGAIEREMDAVRLVASTLR